MYSRAVRRSELDRDVLPVGRRVRTEVHDDVDDPALRATHQLGLRHRRRLVVHAADGPGQPVERDVALHHRRIEALFGELVDAEAAGEEPAVVHDALEFDDEDAADPRLRELHRRARRAGGQEIVLLTAEPDDRAGLVELDRVERDRLVSRARPERAVAWCASVIERYSRPRSTVSICP